MNGSSVPGLDDALIPVSPDEIARARAYVNHQPDAADLLEAIGIGRVIRILTTHQTGARP